MTTSASMGTANLAASGVTYQHIWRSNARATHVPEIGTYRVGRVGDILTSRFIELAETLVSCQGLDEIVRREGRREQTTDSRSPSLILRESSASIDRMQPIEDQLSRRLSQV